MPVLRFLVGLGAGGLWPRGIALVSKCWPGASRPLVSGAMMAGLNAGILKRGPQTLQRKPRGYLHDICRDIVPPLPEAMRSAMDFTRADKLLFCSGHPWVEPAVRLDARRSLNLPAADEQKILRGNARQLLRL